jgi:hypothetical protein
MLMWTIMRRAAVRRHRWVWKNLEGGDWSRWRAHEDFIRSVYGW